MIKKLLFFTALISLLFSLSCGDKKASNKSKTSPTPQVKTGVAPVADDEIAVIEMEDPMHGTIKLELYSNIAPKMVERFKTLARQGFYNGTTFHRVSSIVIQGGDPNSKDSNPDNDGQGESELPDLPAEFSDITYDRGIVGAARSSDVNSANCQFFITIKRTPANAGWDKNYTVFGKVIDGMNNAELISGLLTDKEKPGKAERPVYDVKIKTITIQPR